MVLPAPVNPLVDGLALAFEHPPPQLICQLLGPADRYAVLNCFMQFCFMAPCKVFTSKSVALCILFALVSCVNSLCRGAWFRCS